MCIDCLNKYYTTCEDCGERVHVDGIVFIENLGRDVCVDCCDRNYIRCDECGAWSNNDENECIECGRSFTE